MAIQKTASGKVDKRTKEYKEMVERARKARAAAKKEAKKSKVKIYPVAAVTKDLKGLETVDFAQLKKAGAIAFSDDGEPVSNAKMLAQALKETSWLGSTVLSHCEDKSLSASGIMN